jgi:hypothetical protein
MKTFASIIIAAVSLSCGYTVVERPPQADVAALPDLIIADVRWQAGFVDHTKDIVMDGKPPDSPTPALFFQLDIVNIGQAPFNGRPFIAWSAGESDIAWGNYGRYETPIPGTLSLNAHDTTTVSVTIEQGWYSFQPRLRFLVVTQQVMPQSKTIFREQDRIPEHNLDNNSFDLLRM